MRRFSLALLLLWGCGHDHPPGAPPKDDVPTIQATVWTDRFEVFVEYPPIVAGVPVTLGTHLTDLSSFQPRREGRVVFSAAGEPEGSLEHREEAPKRPGLYLPSLTFPKAGLWKISLRIPVEGSDARVDLPPIRLHASAAEAKAAEKPDAPQGIAFLKEQQWKLGTRTAPVGRRRLIERLRLPGQVTARPGSRASLTAPLEGRLIAPAGRTLPGLGDPVEAGQVVALVQPPFSDLAAKMLEARAEVSRTTLAVSQADQVYARTKKLHEGQAKTDRELQEAEFSLRAAKSAADSARTIHDTYQKIGAVFVGQEGKELPAFELRAPISGTVVSVQASLGEHVGPEHPVLVILDPEKVYIEARIPESDVSRVAGSKGAAYETPDARGKYVPILEGGGRVVHLGLEVDAASRTVPLVYEVPNPAKALRIGMTLTLYAETARVEDAIAIPQSALVDEEGRYVAFVQAAGETFVKRDLVLGLRDTGFVQVVQGLSEGERVVTDGAYAIRLASVSTALPAHGHSH
ncbi:MAG: efflux RND transporter periplasmic adaptor subunit [Planctomycetota bacterium]|nr:MAG: efflux RND transporter periplasmic adaptor subunit [Planctomycetota bacterium]